jgi:SAM-dependent methyltransferase
VPDAVFSDKRLARVYDPLDPDRSDLDVYLDIVDELSATTVLDIGCGTGTFACMLAERGIEVVGVDPAEASLDVARTKPGAEQVQWLLGDATTLPPLQVDLATMTGNVAQVFLTDEEWEATLRGTHAALRPDGHLVFETRNPERRAWLEWTREKSYVKVDVRDVGEVESWHELTDVSGELVSFRTTVVFSSDGAVIHSDSTLRFRERDQVAASLEATGYVVMDVRDAPDRPGWKFVFVARRTG